MRPNLNDNSSLPIFPSSTMAKGKSGQKIFLEKSLPEQKKSNIAIRYSTARGTKMLSVWIKNSLVYKKNKYLPLFHMLKQ